jgi:hypothetical protein
LLPKERFPQIRSLNRRSSPSWGDCSFRLISPPMKFPPQAVIGGSSPPRKAIKGYLEKPRYFFYGIFVFFVLFY